jgi:Flp pilus assembly protein TadD
MTSRVWIVLVLAASIGTQMKAVAQLPQIRIRVTFPNGGCDAAAHVMLMSSNGPPVDGVVNQECEVEFSNIAAGTYRVSVSGQAIADGEAGTIGVTAGRVAEFEVRVRSNSSNMVPGTAFISTAELAIPPRAQKEFDKANELIGKQDFSKAIERLKQAIAICPSYTRAYNNLGVVYARTGDSEHEREALERAIAIDDHFAPAYVNLGRMDLRTRDFANAESQFERASSYDPSDATALVLLSYSQFMNKHFDDAIVSARKAHMLAGPHASAHHIAARAFEQKRDATNAIAELETFLKEEPAGPEAAAAQKELESVRAIPH